jgi:hypothetical protein
MKSEALVKVLCRPFCTYYKPGRNEELLCRGALVIEQLMLSGKIVFSAEAKHTALDEAASDIVVQAVCKSCDFRDHDCDFAQDRKARPCGGYILLSRLLGAKMISIEDIQ